MNLNIARTDVEHYYDMLECLPPAYQTPGFFLVGEPTDHGDDGRPRFSAYGCSNINGEVRYYSFGPMSIRQGQLFGYYNEIDKFERKSAES